MIGTAECHNTAVSSQPHTRDHGQPLQQRRARPRPRHPRQEGEGGRPGGGGGGRAGEDAAAQASVSRVQNSSPGIYLISTQRAYHCYMYTSSWFLS